ncbi:MAG: hypothetical protein M1587_02970 [Thaumarchaeota archaeon]|nr:hypothetical protein [Nitrososphaerota archaeon]
MQRQGFLHSDDVPPYARKILEDPLYSTEPARRFQINGVSSAGHKGAIKFSSVDLFGVRRLEESYLVSDWEKFTKFFGPKLEVMFRATNPNPSRSLKKAFTRFMHNYGLHWTDCYHLIRARNELRKHLRP